MDTLLDGTRLDVLLPWIKERHWLCLLERRRLDVDAGHEARVTLPVGPRRLLSECDAEVSRVWVAMEKSLREM